MVIQCVSVMALQLGRQGKDEEPSSLAGGNRIST